MAMIAMFSEPFLIILFFSLSFLMHESAQYNIPIRHHLRSCKFRMTDRVTSNKACIGCKNHIRQAFYRLYQRDFSAGVNYSVMQYVPLFMSQCGISRVFHIHPGVYLIGNGEVRRPAHQVMVSFIHDIILTERWRCCKHPCLFQYSLTLYGGGEGLGW